jgi:aryl-alcohol dehydrogenase-like predicted oxidoreductase
MKQLEDSLKRLKTDYLDLWQIHEVVYENDADLHFAPGGAVEALVAAKEQGKVKYIGVTGHKSPAIHLKMLARDFAFDAVQMPLSVMDAHYRSFEKEVLPELVRNKIAVLGMKSMANGILLRSGTAKPIECLHYALNLPTSVVITGIDSMEILDQAFEAASTFRPMTPGEVESLLERTARAAANGEFEPFKTTSLFDGTAENPHWLGEESPRVRSLLD